MPQLNRDTVRRRAGELRQEIGAVRQAWLRSQLGRRLTVLAESDGTGHAENFARVRLPEGTPRGAIVAITPTSIEEGLLA
jgi:threonylcarbamoyladenosine tRNA methylthiotransferase MtaB